MWEGLKASLSDVTLSLYIPGIRREQNAEAVTVTEARYSTCSVDSSLTGRVSGGDQSQFLLILHHRCNSLIFTIAYILSYIQPTRNDTITAFYGVLAGTG